MKHRRALRGPIIITALTEIHAVAIDRAGNISRLATGCYEPAGPQVVDAPTSLAGTTNPGQIVAELFDAAGHELGASAPFALTDG